MARNGSSKFPIVPVVIGVAALGGLLYVLSRSVKAPAREVFRTRGVGPSEETWFPFVNDLTAGQTFKAYKGEADVAYSALAAPDRARGLIRARNLQTNQEEPVALYNINRLGAGA